MTLPTCPREVEVIRAVREGEWPGRVDADLRAHAAACDACRETVAVATMLREADAAEHVHVPTSGQMWWRLAVRARIEREEAAARPLVWLQGVAAASVVGLAAGLSGVVQPWLRDAAWAVSGRAALLVPEWPWQAAAPDGAVSLGLMAAVAGSVALIASGAAALYFWLAED